MDLTAYRFQRLREDGELVLFRGRDIAAATTVLLATSASRKTEPEIQRRLDQELSLANDLDIGCAVKPLAMVRFDGRPALLLEDPGGQPLEALIGEPMPPCQIIDIAIAVADCISRVHAIGLIHKDIKPANILIDEDGETRLTGFGLSTRLPRERQAPTPPEDIAGTLAYMAPEQTGRTNRSIDRRSDLYAFGVTLFEMTVGQLPFAASDPLEWIYCHIARLPPAPRSLVPDLPAPLEAIILKLLSKNAEDRYQTAAGVAQDLKACRDFLQLNEPLQAFPLGQHEIRDLLLVPEKLYGREEEIERLQKIYDQVADRGAFELVLVAGYSGLGKSSLVNEIQQALVASGGLFAVGKFDQHKRDIPYATVADAFGGLIRWVLSQSPAEFESWKSRLVQCVGASGQLLIDVIPELALIIGEQQPPPSLLAEDEKTRFYIIFCQFVREFARTGRPLVLFLDNLQWIDAATLELVERIASDGAIPNLLLVGAYRSNEVDEGHGLSTAIANIHKAGGNLTEIHLQPLFARDIIELLADTLHAEPASVAPLATMIFQKTEGNPFFAVQFLTNLHDEGLLHFDRAARRWQWDMARISAKDITSNVAALMAARLTRHQGVGLSAIKYLASIGGSVEAATLGELVGLSESAVDKELREFVGLGLLNRTDVRYSFVHDRVQEAAYELIPKDEREIVHLSIGRLLADNADQDNIEDEIFEIVTQYNRGAECISSPDERLRLAELNLIAGKRAKASSAYQAALVFFAAGCRLLAPESWLTQYGTTFELEFHRADCQLIIGDVQAAAEHFLNLSDQCANQSDRARIVSRQVILYTYLGRIDQAMQLSLDCLSQMGVDLPLRPTREEVEAEFEALIANIGEREIADLIDHPPMRDPYWLEVIELLANMLSPSSLLEFDLFDLACLRIANLSVEHGMTDASVQSFSNLAGRIFGWRLGTFDDGNSLARLAIKLIEERGIDQYAARTYAIVSGVVAPWNMPLRDCFAMSMQAIETPRERVGLIYSGYAWVCAVSALLGSGKSLVEVQKEAEAGLEFAVKSRFMLVVEMISTQLLYIRAMRGEFEPFGLFAQPGISEDDHLRRLESEPHFRHAFTRHRLRSLQVKFHAGQYRDCLDLIAKIDEGRDVSNPVLEQSPVFEIAEYCFYSALARAAWLTTIPRPEQNPHFKMLVASGAQLEKWALQCPANFADRVTLVAAEIARLEGRPLDAERHYEDAVRLAQESGFVQNEALANELAAQFYADRRLQSISDAYLLHARSCYLRWGAHGKVRQLEQQFPHLVDTHSARISALVRNEIQSQQLDLAAMVAMYQAVSGEIVLDHLIERLMETLVEYAGAVRGFLFLNRKGKMQIAAEAIADTGGVCIKLSGENDVAQNLPKSILNYVVHSHETVIIGDAREDNLYSRDPYIRAAKPLSILCLPLVKQRELVGVLYLDNHLSSHVFTPDRLSVLQLVASQAAISIQNAGYFRDVQIAHEKVTKAEEEVRAAFDMMPALAWRAGPDGAAEFSNRQWEEYTGHSLFDGGRERWAEAFHPDDVGKVAAKWRHLIEAGIPGEVEARMRRHDGEYRAFLMRAMPMRNEMGEIVKWHGTNTDIELLKRAEQAQEAIARVSRITAMGELTVSIAHEVNQPLMAIVTNAATCLRWLEAEPLNIEQARLAAERIVRDGHRAGDVIASIRALAKKSSPEAATLDINESVLEVLTLTENEFDRNAIHSQTDLAPGGAFILGDHVQIQQLLLNLILNGIEAINAVDDVPRTLKISTVTNRQGYVEVCVSDSGIGIDPERTDSIFEVFFTTKKDGIGLGLSICRSIVEAHRGTIWTAANDPRGTVVHFRIPALDESASA